MKYPAKTVRLNNGKECVLRSPGPEDAQGMLDYLRTTSGETVFLLRTPEEVAMTAEEEAEFLRAALQNPSAIMIAAVIDGRIVGNTGLSGIGSRSKVRHRATIGIAVEKAYWGLGIGSCLMTEAIAWAKDAGYEQIELEVIETNESAVRLYSKYGFEKFGRRERAFKLKDGTYCDELLMMKKLI